jgi:MOSC domain-containing protein YiiM
VLKNSLSVAMIQIRHLYISPGHNYFGHHGRPAGEHPIIEVPRIRCVAGKGIEGDRFFDYKPDYKGQITFFRWEEYARLCATFDVQDKTPAVFRRNAITEGLDLQALIDQEFEIQGVRFRGRAECSPCYWMDQAFCPGTEAALKGQGGLRAQILSDGILEVPAELEIAGREHFLAVGRTWRF